MRLGLRRQAYWARYARALHHMPQAAGGIPQWRLAREECESETCHEPGRRMLCGWRCEVRASVTGGCYHPDSSSPRTRLRASVATFRDAGFTVLVRAHDRIGLSLAARSLLASVSQESAAALPYQSSLPRDLDHAGDPRGSGSGRLRQKVLRPQLTESATAANPIFAFRWASAGIQVPSSLITRSVPVDRAGHFCCRKRFRCSQARWISNRRH